MKTSNFIFAAILVVAIAEAISAQTSAFTYQGRFTDGGKAANGTYEMQFKLFDEASIQVGSTVTNAAVVVSDGVFTVQLDYGSAAFPGTERFLEIGVRPAGSGNSFTVLSPLQHLTSAVYAIRAGSTTTADTATNATQLGGVAANQYVQTGDSRLTDPRIPTAGSGNYIQINPANKQTGGFNINGDGIAATLSAKSIKAGDDYYLSGKRVLSAPFDNIAAGAGAGSSLLFGVGNSFFGADAGFSTDGLLNTFVGKSAGRANTDRNRNSFFGAGAGVSSNADDNSFFGQDSGINNVGGFGNTFVGQNSGSGNVSGANNTAVGQSSASVNPGNQTTLIGAFASTDVAGLTNATALGYKAHVSQSNSLVLGSINNGPGSTDTNVGIGTTAPNARFHIAVNGGNILMGNAGCSSGFTGIGFGTSLTGCANYSLLGNGADTIINRPTGGQIAFRENNTTQLSIAAGGVVSITTLGAAGSTSLCRNASNQISTCSSSLRYKQNIQSFIGGLSVLKQLRPITFDWKQGGMHDLGFGAEDIAAVEPLLVTRNDKGEVEGVKYDRISAVLVNAVKEQQAEIEVQREQIAHQQSELTLQRKQIEDLRSLVTRNRRHFSTHRAN